MLVVRQNVCYDWEKLGGDAMNYPYKLEDLNYDYSALEPCLSKRTLEFHHDKHLQTYVNNLNDALGEDPQLKNKSIDQILKMVDELDGPTAIAIRNNAGGVFNHNFYFEALAEPMAIKPSEYLERELTHAFGSKDWFLEEFKKAALAQFGSGWAWLVVDETSKLKIVTTPNQETPLKDKMEPILTIDVWEHAYYLDYQNRRAEYIDQYFSIINWNVVEERLRNYYVSHICCHSHG